MIHFNKLTLQGFRSFRLKQVFHFPETQAGFYLVSGPNGSGKSSLWGGLCWTLYGKTERGLKAKAIGNWEDDELTMGILRLTRNDTLYKIKRTWNPNSLTLTTNDGDPRTVEQEEIDKLLGYTYESFLASVLMGQFNSFFFDLEPTDKLNVFSSALGLDYWVTRADKAKEQAKQLSQSVQRSERDEASLQGILQATSQKRDEWANLSDSWQETHDKHVRTLERELGLIEPIKDKYERTYKSLKKKRQQLEEDLDTIQRRALKMDDGLKQARDELRDKGEQYSNVFKDIEELEKDPKTCPACGQPVPPEHYLGEKSKLIKRREQLKESTLALQDEVDQREAALAVKVSDISTLQKAQKLARESEVAVKEQYEAEQSEYDDHARSLQRISKEDNPYPGKLREAKEQLNKVKLQLTTCTEQLDKDRAQQRAMETWAKLFKELRLWLVEEAVQQLQVEVNNTLGALGLPDWQVTCVVEQETQKGTLHRGFDVLISSPKSGDRKVPWKAWCGGETQKLRVAGAIGLQSLIQGRQGNRIQAEVWDEPTAHLSEQAVADLLGFFEARSREENKQVWLVDHRSLKVGNFDSEVRVLMTRDGTKIVQE